MTREARGLLAAIAAVTLVGASPSPMHVNGGRLNDLLLALSEFGRNPEGGVTRLGFSREDQAARAWITERMKEAGLAVSVDPAANLHGRRAGSDPSLPVILFGSHIDSVPKGGNFDGDVGSIGALEVMLTLRDEEAAPAIPSRWSSGPTRKGSITARASSAAAWPRAAPTPPSLRPGTRRE